MICLMSISMREAAVLISLERLISLNIFSLRSMAVIMDYARTSTQTMGREPNWQSIATKIASTTEIILMTLKRKVS